MKRFLLSAASAFLAVYGFAQSPAAKVSPAQRAQGVKIPVHTVINQNPDNPQGGLNFNGPSVRNAIETVVGTSTYDLQSNSAIQRRIINHPNGSISAAWTFSSVNSWATRGTGYNYFNGLTWGSNPTSEIETERTGWPSLLATASGREVILSHSTASNEIRQSARNTIGSGTWSQGNLTPLATEVWNRAAVGGANGNTIHMVAMTAPTANGGNLYNGMDGAFLYNRSVNGGLTWDIQNYQIPGTDSSYFSSFDGDSYHIDAKGDTVAIVIGGLGTGVQLFKSVDNGVTWTQRDVIESDVWFEESTTFIGTAIDSALYTSDGTVNVLIDNNGICHVWYGAMFIANDDLTDGLITYFPGTNSIDYWNENMNDDQPLTLAGALDINGNGGLDLIGTNVGDVTGQYRFSGLASHPQAGIDANGCMYVVYSAIREDLSNGAQHYRHTYLTKSCDGGCSWSFPIDLTDVDNGSNDFKECVFASIARRVDSNVHVLYMSDLEPGMAVSGDQDSPTTNSFVYSKEAASRFDTTLFCLAEIQGDSLVCPGGSVVLDAVGCASAYSWTGPNSFSSTAASVTVSDLGVYTCTFTQSCGTQSVSFEVVSATGNGNGPMVQISSDKQIMCPGDNAILTASSNVGGSSYLWSNGATTASTTVSSPGTYSVTVADCNGTTVESFTISQPTNAPAAVISGDTAICPGENIVLSALPVLSGSYSWSTGAQTSSTTVNAAGTYTVTVSNCGGTSTASITVTAEAAPTAAVTTTTLEGCDGEPLTVVASGGTSYAWSNGTNTAALTLSAASESGTYVVTVTNDCGDSDTASVQVTIHDIPSAPVVSWNGTDFVSSQTGTHTWYINGTEVSGITGNSLPAQGYVDQGDLVTATYTDENGCTSPLSTVLVGVEDVSFVDQNVSLYPNPTNGLFEVRFGAISGKVEVEITNIVGQVVYSNAFNSVTGSAKTIDLSNVEAGVYQISINAVEGKTVKNIVIE